VGKRRVEVCGRVTRPCNGVFQVAFRRRRAAAGTRLRPLPVHHAPDKVFFPWPYSIPGNHGAWAFGKKVLSTNLNCGQRPVRLESRQMRPSGLPPEPRKSVGHRLSCGSKRKGPLSFLAPTPQRRTGPGIRRSRGWGCEAPPREIVSRAGNASLAAPFQ